MKRATRTKKQEPLTDEPLTEQLVAAHPSTRVKELHQIAGSLVDISDDLEGYLSAGIIEELDDAWRAVESVRDSILHMG